MADNFTLTEYPNLELFNFITHPDIDPKQKERYISYIKLAKEKGHVEVTYTKEEFGRFFVSNHFLTCTNMWNKIRSTLFSKSDIDIDVVNCHSEILLGLLKMTQGQLDYDYLAKYCKNRDEIIDSIWISEKSINKYNKECKDNKTHRDIVKSLFTIILYGGNIQTWTTEYKLKESDYKLTSFVKRFISELHENIHTFVKLPEFKSIYNFSKNKQLVSAKTKYAKNFKEEQFVINHFKVLSLILQEYESKVVISAIEYMQNQGFTVTSYNYDGFQIRVPESAPGASAGILDTKSILEYLNTFIKEMYPNMNLIFINKPFKSGLPLDEFVTLDSERYIRDIMNKTPIYFIQKEYFEKFHFKVMSPFCFICEDSTGITFIKPNSLVLMYKDIKTEPPIISKIKTFIPYWITDTSMRYYDKINYYPRASECPENEYNLWRPFPILKTTDVNADTSFIHTFIQNVVSESVPGASAVYNYILNWFAHILQFPHRKTEVCLIFYGDQGCGKSSIAEHLMKLIIGDDKMMITCKVDKAFGRFVNTQGKLLAVLNETSGKDTFNISEILKDAITCQQTEQEKKGIDPISIRDYTNYIFTTNNINSVKIPKDDRRYMPIKLNDTYIKDKVNIKPFFDKLYSYLDNPEVMRTFYSELMQRDLSNFSLSVDRVETELMKDMKMMNADPIDQFIDYWAAHLTTHMQKRMQSADLYQKFIHFWEVVEGYKPADRPSHKKFGGRLKQFTERVRYIESNFIYYELLI